ncbi:rod shape-determining protein RodA [Candidatus Parcubacteria bacterium]|nr:rod shape-determining protein RodA [Candidatus Parcubacteria bacterium]
MNKIIFYLKNFDWILFSAVLLLLFFGLSEIYSIALSRDSVNLLIFKKQAIFIGIGILILFFLAFFDYHNIRSMSTYIYIFGILMLVGVLIFGKTVRGTTGWFDVAGFSMQPVEFAKLIIIVYLAKYFSGNSIRVNPLKHLIISGFGAFIFIFLIFKQPDFGSGLILFFIWGIIIVLAGFSKKYIIIISLILVTIFGSGWIFFFEDYQKERIATFLDPSADPLGEGYNVNQAIIAVGSGGWTGRGLGFGSQSQLKFLPESQNDFIFAVIAEELGFLGVCMIIIFFSIFYLRLLQNIKNIKNDFGVYFILGVLGLIFIEMFINIGMNIGLMPVVGISLPFISYGGSSVVSTLMMVGIVESIIIRSKIKY